MPIKRNRLIAGLGNPGRKYEKTRHNIGFMVADEIAGAFSIPVEKKKYDTVFGRGMIKGVDTVIVKPMAYMNRSGSPVQRIAHFFKILSEDMLVVHDDIDLALGRIKIKEKGGHGGHNGVKSLMDAFGGGDFIRIRIGIGRSEAGKDVTGHVLGKFDKNESDILNESILRARDAVVTILTKGVKDGMNLFNMKNS